jgi:hypothetical protein
LRVKQAVEQFLDDLRQMSDHHPVARGKRAFYNLNGYGSGCLADKPPHLDCHGTERI